MANLESLGGCAVLCSVVLCVVLSFIVCCAEPWMAIVVESPH